MYINHRETRHRPLKHNIELLPTKGSANLKTNNSAVKLISDNQLFDFISQNINGAEKQKKSGLSQYVQRIVKNGHSSSAWINALLQDNPSELTPLMEGQATLFSQSALKLSCYLLKVRLEITYQDSFEKRTECYGEVEDKLVTAIGTDDGYIVQLLSKYPQKSAHFEPYYGDLVKKSETNLKQNKFIGSYNYFKDHNGQNLNHLSNVCTAEVRVDEDACDGYSKAQKMDFEQYPQDYAKHYKKNVHNRKNKNKQNGQKKQIDDQDLKIGYELSVKDVEAKENIRPSTISNDSTKADGSNIFDNEHDNDSCSQLLKPRAHNFNSDNSNNPDFKRALDFICNYQIQIQQKPNANVDMKKYKPLILAKTDEFITGKLKFYKDKEKFGFILLEDMSEIFLHKDNLVRSNIDSTAFQNCTQFFDIILKFKVLYYQSSKNCKTKAVDVEIENFVPKAKFN